MRRSLRHSSSTVRFLFFIFHNHLPGKHFFLKYYCVSLQKMISKRRVPLWTECSRSSWPTRRTSTSAVTRSESAHCSTGTIRMVRLAHQEIQFLTSFSGSLLIGSEVKCIEELCERVEYFPPGCCATISLSAPNRPIQPQQYYSVPTIADRFLSVDCTQTLVKDILVKAVEKRLMGNRNFGFMLSGGLDSSLIASIATRFLKQKPIAFSVGFEDSPDLENAKRVADYLKIPHEVLVITPQQCIDIIPGNIDTTFFVYLPISRGCLRPGNLRPADHPLRNRPLPPLSAHLQELRCQGAALWGRS